MTKEQCLRCEHLSLGVWNDSRNTIMRALCNLIHTVYEHPVFRMNNNINCNDFKKRE